MLIKVCDDERWRTVLLKLQHFESSCSMSVFVRFGGHLTALHCRWVAWDGGGGAGGERGFF